MKKVTKKINTIRDIAANHNYISEIVEKNYTEKNGKTEAVKYTTDTTIKTSSLHLLRQFLTKFQIF